jgi:hypothetical protein
MSKIRQEHDAREWEVLLEQIRDGTIESADDLDADALAMLRRRFGDEEKLEPMLDRLRGEEQPR